MKPGTTTHSEHRTELLKARQAAANKARNDKDLLECEATCPTTRKPFRLFIKPSALAEKKIKYPDLKVIRYSEGLAKLNYYEDIKQSK